MTLAKDAKLKIGGRVDTLCAERYAPSAESQAESKAQRPETADRRPEIEDC